VLNQSDRHAGRGGGLGHGDPVEAVGGDEVGDRGVAAAGVVIGDPGHCITISRYGIRS
jgi:hypothetical protein